MDLRFQDAHAISVDHERGKLYWSNHAGKAAAFGKPPEARRAVWRANLDGSDPEPLFGGLTEPDGIAVEPASGDLFYFDSLRMVRGSFDGKKEAVMIEPLELPYSGYNRAYRASNAVVDADGGKIYWSHGESFIARANLDGSGFEVSLAAGDVNGVGVDPTAQKIYWTHGSGMEVWRANLDGSQSETIALGMRAPLAIDVDSENGYVYWTDSKVVGIDSFALIRRLKLPPLPVAERLPAPPLVSSLTPRKQRAGRSVAVRGSRFSGVTNVRVVGDDGTHSDCKFSVVDDSKLTFKLPPRDGGVNRLAIILQGPGGVTVTLPRDARLVKRNDRRMATFDRFHERGAFCFVVSPGQAFARVEHSLVFAPRDAEATAGGRGNTVFFLKDGSTTHATDASGVVIYIEPFARVSGRARASGDDRYIAVPAIRPSFVESLLEYADDE